MKYKPHSNLMLNSINVIDIIFNSKRPLDETADVKLNINTWKHTSEEQPDLFRIIFRVELQAKDYFNLEIATIGDFELSSEIDESLRDHFINSNAPTLLFPYVRSFISTLTANLGRAASTIVLPTQSFSGELKEIEEYPKDNKVVENKVKRVSKSTLKGEDKNSKPKKSKKSQSKQS